MIRTQEPENIPLKILAVDDEPNALKTIKSLLEDHGCEVEGAVDATDALAIARRSQFDAVVIDQLLPGQTGLELLGEIRRVRHHQPAIIISGVDPTDDLQRQIADLNAIFIKKSNLFPELIDKMIVLLERESNPIKVFISYANPNFEKVSWIYTRLRDNGFVPWMDRMDIPPGFAWDKQVEKAIEESDFVLSCLSDIAVKRLGFFQEETRLAVAKHDRVGEPFILPLRFDNCDLPGEFVERNIQYITYDENNEWWERLRTTLRSKRR